MIVGISGLSGSGKSAAGDILVKNHGYIPVAFADIMKRICMEVFDFTEEQVWGDGKNTPDERYPRERSVHDIEMMGKLYLTPRYALQKLGSWGRDCYPMVWAEHTLRVAKKLLEHNYLWYTRTEGLVERVEQCPQGEFERDGVYEMKGVVITDVRFKNEMKAVKDAGGKVVRIVRPGYEKPQWDHASETEQLEVPDSEFDYILFNDGSLEKLAEKTGMVFLGLLNGGRGMV